MHKILSAAFLIFFSLSVKAQIKLPPIAEKVIHKFLSNEKDTTRKPSLMPLPVLSYAQETGYEFGIMGLYSFYTDRKDSLIRNSSIAASASFTTKKQSYGKIISDIWTRGNQYHYNTEIRYRNFPYYYYGIGAHTQYNDRVLVSEKRFRIKSSIEKKTSDHWYTGFVAGYDYYSYKDTQTTGIFHDFPPYGKNGGKLLSVGIMQTFDNRNNNTYTTKGQFAQLIVNYAPDFFGKDNYKGLFGSLEYRYFRQLHPKLILGINGNWFSYFGKNVPFYLLPQLGADDMMRGYYSGRYRDKNMMAYQAELRYRFIPRFGAVAFGGTGAVYGEEKLGAKSFKPNYGIGIRYFFDLQRDLSVRIDYGVGEKHSGEKRQSGVYFSLAEAF